MPNLRTHWNQLVSAMCWAGSLACLLVYVQFATQFEIGSQAPQFIWTDTEQLRRGIGLFNEATTAGAVAAMTLSVAWYRLPRATARTAAALWLVFALAVVALLLSFSRGVLLNASLALGVLTFLQPNRLRRFVVLLCLGVGLLFGGVLAASVDPNSALGHYFDLRIAGSLQNLNDPFRFTSGRTETWGVILSLFSSSPELWVNGIGYKTLELWPPALMLTSLGFVIGDNNFLTSLIETGVTGSLALVAFFVTLLYASARAARSRGQDAGVLAFAIAVGYTAQMMTGDAFTLFRAVPVLLVLVASAALVLRPAPSVVPQVEGRRLH